MIIEFDVEMLVAKTFDIDVNGGEVQHEKNHTMKESLASYYEGEVLQESIIEEVWQYVEEDVQHKHNICNNSLAHSTLRYINGGV